MYVCVCIYMFIFSFAYLTDYLVLDNLCGHLSQESIDLPSLSSHETPVALHLRIELCGISPVYINKSISIITMVVLFSQSYC